MRLPGYTPAASPGSGGSPLALRPRAPGVFEAATLLALVAYEQVRSLPPSLDDKQKNERSFPAPAGSRDEGKPPGETRRLCVAVGRGGIRSRPERRVGNRTYRTPKLQKHIRKRPREKLKSGWMGEGRGNARATYSEEWKGEKNHWNATTQRIPRFCSLWGGEGVVQQVFFSIMT